MVCSAWHSSVGAMLGPAKLSSSSLCSAPPTTGRALTGTPGCSAAASSSACTGAGWVRTEAEAVLPAKYPDNPSSSECLIYQTRYDNLGGKLHWDATIPLCVKPASAEGNKLTPGKHGKQQNRHHNVHALKCCMQGRVEGLLRTRKWPAMRPAVSLWNMSVLYSNASFMASPLTTRSAARSSCAAPHLACLRPATIFLPRGFEGQGCLAAYLAHTPSKSASTSACASAL